MVTTLRPRLHFLLIINDSYFCTCAERGKAAKHFISEGLISILSEVTQDIAEGTQHFP